MGEYKNVDKLADDCVIFVKKYYNSTSCNNISVIIDEFFSYYKNKIPLTMHLKINRKKLEEFIIIQLSL